MFQTPRLLNHPCRTSERQEGKTMTGRFRLLAAVPLILCADLAVAQRYPLLDAIADKVVHKYQGATCEQLWQERAAGGAKAKPQEEQRFIQFLREDSGARAEFFKRVSSPIVTKMFECGMVP
jgi:hypothetical protein